MNPSIVVKDLSITLDGNIEALKRINLELPHGKTIGLIGPSGAGKTTLIRAIVGRLPLTHGQVSVLGLPAGTAQLRQQITYMPQELSVYPDLTVRENISYFATMAGQPLKKTRQVVAEILKSVDLLDKAASLVSSLSGGQKQRVSLAVALIGAPQILVLDEPTVGLDPVLRQKLWELFKQLADGGTTLIISSHSMDEASRCDDLVLIRDGQLVAHSTPQELLKQTHCATIEESFIKLVKVQK